MDKLKLILGLFSLGGFSIWMATLEYRLRKATAADLVDKEELQENANAKANAALSDADTKSKLDANLRS